MCTISTYQDDFNATLFQTFTGINSGHYAIQTKILSFLIKCKITNTILHKNDYNPSFIIYANIYVYKVKF